MPLPAGGGSGSKDVRAGNPTLWILLCLKFLQENIIVSVGRTNPQEKKSKEKKRKKIGRWSLWSLIVSVFARASVICKDVSYLLLAYYSRVFDGPDSLIRQSASVSTLLTDQLPL